jgi:hypothetical protein
MILPGSGGLLIAITVDYRHAQVYLIGLHRILHQLITSSIGQEQNFIFY